MESTKPDVVLKDFWRDNQRFADLFNAVLFQGKEVLKPDSLEEQDTEVSGIIEMKDYKETLSRTRDVVKKMADGVEFVIFAAENQQRVHYAMPLRNMLYDSMGYLKECQELSRKHRADGETGWDGPCSLHDMIFDMPEEIQAVFSDYPMNLLEVRDSGKYLFHNPDVRTVFEISREAMAGISMRYEKNTGIYRSILNC